MNMIKSIDLMEKYAECPDCGSDSIGNGTGGLIVEEDTLRRFCKCGFDIIVDYDGNEIKTIKLDLRLTEKEAIMLKEYIGCQEWEDTDHIIDIYNLKMKTDDMDNILYKLYDCLNKIVGDEE